MVCGYSMMGGGMMGYTGGLFGLFAWLLILGLVVLVWLHVFRLWGARGKRR